MILLVSWIALGLAHTGYVMIRPHGLIIRRPPELSRTIGLPAWVEGPGVIAAADLIDGAAPPDGAAILLVRPPDDAPEPWGYIHFQLAHLVYPRRVDLIEAGAPPPLDPERYATLLAPPETPVGDGWTELETTPEFVLYQRVVGP